LSINPYEPSGGAEQESDPSVSNQGDGGQQDNVPSLVLVILTLLVATAAWFSIAANVPKLYAPYPALVTVPALLGAPPLVIAVTAAFTFALSQVRHFLRRPPPKPSLVLFLLTASVTLLTLFAIYSNWDYGIQYQGKPHVIGVSILNLCFAAAVGFLWYRSRKNGRGRMQVAFGFTLFIWIFWCAIPVIGELP
jgi:hypothetical protein